MSGAHPSSSHPTLSRIEQVLNSNRTPQASRDPATSIGARRQSFAGTSALRPSTGARSTPNPPAVPAAAAATPTPRSMGVFVPRYVRGTIDREQHAPQPQAAPRPPQHSPTRNRRPSGSVLPASPSRTPSRMPSASASTSAAIASASSFPQPAYIKESALRHLIQSESPRAPLPNRTRFDSLNPSPSPSPAPAATSSMPIASPILYWPRDMSPGRSSETDDDELMPQQPPPPPPPPALTLQPERIMPLPTRWSDTDRFLQLTVSPDGRDLTFHGPTGTVDEAAAARANHPIPPACGIYYYEVEILNRGRQGHISIGFSAKHVKLTRLPGWEGLSWGYHGDDGRTFADQRTGTQYGPTFTAGDRVGCGVDFAQGKAFFTKNGRFIDYVFQDLEGGPGRELYPSIGLRSTDESIRANFGQEPFAFDIVSHVQQQRNATWARIQSTRVKWITRDDRTFVVEGIEAKAKEPPAPDGDESSNLTSGINELILGYLTHHGYAGAARAFKAQSQAKASTPDAVSSSASSGPSGDDVLMSTGDDVPAVTLPPVKENDTDTQARQRIYHAVLAGDMDRALHETSVHYPAVLEREKGLMHFKLRCRKFGEMIIEAAEALRRQQQREQVQTQRRMDEVAQGVLIEEEEEEEEGDDSMDIDDDATHTNGHAASNGDSAATTGAPVDTAILKGKMKAVPLDSHAEMQRAVEYGRALHGEYAADTRPEVVELFRRTSVLWAFESPREQGGAITEYASQAARAELANELNQAILESQGKPAQPALERLYRHTEACIMTLGAIGVGAAAFADMRREFLEN